MNNKVKRVEDVKVLILSYWRNFDDGFETNSCYKYMYIIFELLKFYDVCWAFPCQNFYYHILSKLNHTCLRCSCESGTKSKDAVCCILYYSDLLLRCNHIWQIIMERNEWALMQYSVKKNVFWFVIKSQTYIKYYQITRVGGNGTSYNYLP